MNTYWMCEYRPPVFWMVDTWGVLCCAMLWCIAFISIFIHGLRSQGVWAQEFLPLVNFIHCDTLLLSPFPVAEVNYLPHAHTHTHIHTQARTHGLNTCHTHTLKHIKKNLSHTLQLNTHTFTLKSLPRAIDHINSKIHTHTDTHTSNT